VRQASEVGLHLIDGASLICGAMTSNLTYFTRLRPRARKTAGSHIAVRAVDAEPTAIAHARSDSSRGYPSALVRAISHEVEGVFSSSHSAFLWSSIHAQAGDGNPSSKHTAIIERRIGDLLTNGK
jgi:hypothetical protein